MTDLTDKWKSGELETGAYYVKDERSNVYIDEYDNEYSCGYYLRTCFSSDNVSEVLAPVPSYDELLKLESDSLAKKEGEEIIAELENELEKLKEDIRTGRCYLEK